MSQVDQIGPQFYLGEEHQCKVEIDIDVAVSFYIKKKIKADQGHFSKLMSQSNELHIFLSIRNLIFRVTPGVT